MRILLLALVACTPAAGQPRAPASREQIRAAFEILTLDEDLRGRLARLGVAPVHGVVTPRMRWPRCGDPPRGDACEAACAESLAICDDADQICDLAEVAGGSPDCGSGDLACFHTRDRCCDCQRR